MDMFQNVVKWWIYFTRAFEQIECACFAPKVSWNMTHQEVNTEPYGPFESQQVSQSCIKLLEGLIFITLTKWEWWA